MTRHTASAVAVVNPDFRPIQFPRDPFRVAHGVFVVTLIPLLR